MSRTVPLWRDPAPLVLASGSATRRDLLASAGLVCETHPADLDERGLEEEFLARGDSPEELALGLAGAKALAVSRLRPASLVIGADQVLACGAERFHKPRSREDAASQILRLAGRTHHLHDGVAIARGGRILVEFTDSAAMTMRRLDTAAVEHYCELAGETVFGSVGGYRLEGAGVHLFQRVEGAHSTVLGLPLLPLLAHLRALGALSL